MTLRVALIFTLHWIAVITKPNTPEYVKAVNSLHRISTNTKGLLLLQQLAPSIP
jgi:hypothetical protein